MLLSRLLGHPWIHEHFRRVLAAGSLAPAYLFVGPRGVGKSTFAQALARAAMCRDRPGEGCSDCASCHKMQAGTHPDLRVVAPGPEDPFSIEMVRELREQVRTAPWESALRCFVLEDVERMSIPAAGALLKTLEEPPPHARLVLVAETLGAVLPTIESRCQLVRFGPLPASAIEQELVRRGTPPEQAAAVASVCGGSLGAALAGQEGLLACRARLLEVWAARLPSGAAGRALAEVLAGLSTPEQRRLAARALDLLASLLRDRLVRCFGAGAPLHADVAPSLLDRLPSDVEALLSRLDMLEDGREAIASNVSPKNVLEDAGALLLGASNS